VLNLPKNFVPKPYRIANKRATQTVLSVEVATNELINELYPHVQFWSHTFFKVQPNTYATRFRVYTRRRISTKILNEIIQQRYPENTKLELVQPYSITQSFDLMFKEPMRWDDFIHATAYVFRDVIKRF